MWSALTPDFPAQDFSHCFSTVELRAGMAFLSTDPQDYKEGEEGSWG